MHIDMAGVALQGKLFLPARDDLVFDKVMAVEARRVVPGHMVLVDKWYVIELGELFGLVMTGHTLFL